MDQDCSRKIYSSLMNVRKDAIVIVDDETTVNDTAISGDITISPIGNTVNLLYPNHNNLNLLEDMCYVHTTIIVAICRRLCSADYSRH